MMLYMCIYIYRERELERERENKKLYRKYYERTIKYNILNKK